MAEDGKFRRWILKSLQKYVIIIAVDISRPFILLRNERNIEEHYKYFMQNLWFYNKLIKRCKEWIRVMKNNYVDSVIIVNNLCNFRSNLS